MRPKVLIALLITGALVATPASDLQAKRRKREKGSVATRVDVREINNQGDIVGLIQAKVKDCREGRKVRIERDGERIGSGVADANGEYVIQPEGVLNSGDTIVAKVDKAQLGKKQVRKKSSKSKAPSDGDGAKKQQKKKKKTKTKKTYCASDTSRTFDIYRVTVFVVGPGTVVSTPEGISCGPGSGTCSALFGATTTRLDAHPHRNPPSEFEEWRRDCAYAGSQPTCELDNDENDKNREAEAHFTGEGGGGDDCAFAAIPVLGPILCGLIP